MKEGTRKKCDRMIVDRANDIIKEIGGGKKCKVGYELSISKEKKICTLIVPPNGSNYGELVKAIESRLSQGSIRVEVVPSEERL